MKNKLLCELKISAAKLPLKQRNIYAKQRNVHANKEHTTGTEISSQLQGFIYTVA